MWLQALACGQAQVWVPSKLLTEYMQPPTLPRTNRRWPHSAHTPGVRTAAALGFLLAGLHGDGVMLLLVVHALAYVCGWCATLMGNVASVVTYNCGILAALVNPQGARWASHGL